MEICEVKAVVNWTSPYLYFWALGQSNGVYFMNLYSDTSGNDISGTPGEIVGRPIYWYTNGVYQGFLAYTMLLCAGNGIFYYSPKSWTGNTIPDGLFLNARSGVRYEVAIMNGCLLVCQGGTRWFYV